MKIFDCSSFFIKIFIIPLIFFVFSQIHCILSNTKLFEKIHFFKNLYINFTHFIKIYNITSTFLLFHKFVRILKNKNKFFFDQRPLSKVSVNYHFIHISSKFSLPHQKYLLILIDGKFHVRSSKMFVHLSFLSYFIKIFIISLTFFNFSHNFNFSTKIEFSV